MLLKRKNKKIISGVRDDVHGQHHSFMKWHLDGELGLEDSFHSGAQLTPVVIACVVSMIPGGRCMVVRPKTMFLRLLFAAWKEIAIMMQVAALQKEKERMKEFFGKQSSSIWQMHKHDLVEVAIAELGMTRAVADKETVFVLRERIRMARFLPQRRGNTSH